MSQPAGGQGVTPIDPAAFVDGLLEIGYDYFCSVPCSYFGSVLSELESRPEVVYQVASVEAEAIAMAAGAALAGRNALVMIQNSGLGNCINPISSLLDPFEIPLVLLVSHRGATPDAPQHNMMGSITKDLLSLVSMPPRDVPSGQAEALEVFAQTLQRARAQSRPQGLVLGSKGLFAKGKPEAETYADRPSRLQATRAIAAALGEKTLVVASTGMVSRDVQTAADRKRNFYMVGSMGLASSIALGLATSQDGPVVVVDGDGSFLMRLGSLPTIGRYAPKNLLHVVLDNGTHSSTGGQRTAAANVDIPAVARAAGYRSAAALETLDELASEIAGFQTADGPRLVHFRIRSGNEPDPPRVERTLQEVRADFMAAIASDSAAAGAS